MYDNEIAFKNRENAIKTANTLLDEGYVVMISLEEDLTIVDFEWTPIGSNRNGVVFMSRDEYEEIIFPSGDYEDNVEEDDRK